MGMGIREYARHRGVSHVAVMKAIKTGRITLEPDGSIDPAKADAQWNRNTDPGLQRGKAAPAPTAPASQPKAANSTTDPGGVPNYQLSRAVRETFRAKNERIDYEERMKTLVKSADVLKVAFETGRRVRDLMQVIPSRVSVVLSGETNPLTIERILDEEIRYALEELAE